MITKWLPEAPKYPGVYAIEPEKNKGRNFTTSAVDALHFETREQCAAWIAENPVPAWLPREHGFG